MRKVIGFLVGSAILGAIACSDDGSLGGSDNTSSSTSSSTSGGPGSSTSTSGSPGVDLTKPIETIDADVTMSRTLDNKKNWLLKNTVYVKAGQTLTIEKGTTIFGDNQTKAILVIEPGAKLLAEGTAEEPIVFTSQAPEGEKRAGDWGGVVLLGKAPINVPGGKGNIEGILKTVAGTEYGGDDPNDDSGVIKYVRIEYAGVILSPDNEVNGLTFGGVGAGTTVDYVQVRMSLDDCFEFFGGTVNAKHLVCQRNQDDAFDFDNGYTGKLQFLVLQQDPDHVGEDNGFESDNDATGTANLPLTNPTVFNVTLCGKNKEVDNAQFGLLVRRNARGSFNNMIVTGFESSLDVRDATGAALLSPVAGQPQLDIKGTLFFNSKGNGVVDDIAYPETGAAAPNKDNDNGLNEVEWVMGGARGNAKTDPGISCFDASAPVFGPATSLTAGALTPPNDGFFDSSAAYIGAFKDANDTWATTGKWVVWSDK
ncbi:MAG: hypothetical protein KIT84_17220 [Labilithrix sp.]|nr:hypothetical protein [Labilithrix sp.]MCW5812772.1 hypothetical protein [Labilithrix sp.]